MLGSLRLMVMLALAFCASVQAQNFELYVLPPGDDNWILGTPYIKFGSGINPPAQRLEMDLDNCGWFKKVYRPSESIPEDDAWIWLGAEKSDDRVGVKGLLGEDPVDWPGDGSNPTPINLKAQFDAVVGQDTPGKLYFFAQEGRWAANLAQIPEEKSRCEYSFAAIIYQRTKGNGDGFSWYGVNSPGQTNATQDYGICKGIVKETLDENGKMQFNGFDCLNNAPYAANPNGSNWDGGTKDMADAEANFYNAFKETPGQNEVKCWNMPFQKRPGGLWEFDAYYLCKNDLLNNPSVDYNSTSTTGCGTGANAGNVGGFYPGFGYYGGATGGTNPARVGVDVQFNGDRVGVKKTHEWCFDRGWSGQGGPVDLSGLTTQAALDDAMRTACGSSAKLYPISSTGTGLISQSADSHDITPPNGYGRATNVVGGHLCFESQNAEFTYEKGQEFFFRGDDDIWIFINNQLVVDLGGTHMPAPGYVKLDTIQTPERLVEGKKYPIKIFFCDRRGAGSNVRISTNIYFSQKSGLYLKEGTAQILGDVCLETTGAGGGCDAIATSASSSVRCGSELKGELNYFITRRDGTGRIELTKDSEFCTWDENAKTLSCYGSITINFDDGQVRVSPTATGLVGTWVVWAEIIGTDVAPLRLGTTAGRTVIQVVWGNVVKEGANSKLDTIVKIPYKQGIDGKVGMEAVASKLIPVAFADGAWVKDSSSAEATFEVDMTTSPGKKVRLQQSSLSDSRVPGSYLRADSAGTGLDSVNVNGEFTIPESGVLVLYFTGEFEADTTATYQINSRSTNDPFALKVHQPKIEFIDSSIVVTKSSIIPQNQRVGSDPSKTGSAKDHKWVFVGTPVNRRIAAFDPIDTTLCETCTFLPRQVATDAFVRTRGTDSRAPTVIQFSNKKLEEGIGGLSLNSFMRLEHERDSVGYFTIGGPSPAKNTISRWDSLYFKEPPVPYPVSAEIFDRNGDGKGDSIRIVYNRTIPSDTLPNKVQVIWSLKDTVSFGLAQKNARGEYTNAGIDSTANKKYWMEDNKYLKKGVCAASVKECGDTIVIAVPYDSTALQFSSDIKTASHSADEVVLSWSSFTDQGESTTQSFPFLITDRIPPIVISARYEAEGSGECGTDASNYCRDLVHIELSELVEKAEDAADETANEAFAYKLQAKKDAPVFAFEVQKEEKSLPRAISWSKLGRFPSRDSVVRLTYFSYKNDNDNSYTPFPGDSVRLLDKLGGKPEAHAYRDLAGNAPNPNEWGRRLEGKGRSSVNKNLLAAVDPLTSEEAIKERIRNRFGRPNGEILAERFNRESPSYNPIQWMPVPGGWKGDSLSKELGQVYSSTVGTVFWPEAAANIRYLESESGYGTIPRGNIFFVANSFYHTNLGNYVVKSGEVRIPCDDPVFKIDGAKDCTDERENGIYLAWDLRDNKGRWVGTGAYVQVYNYYWEVKDAPVKTIKKDDKNVDVNVNGVLDRYPGEGNKVEMFGVRRAAKKE